MISGTHLRWTKLLILSTMVAAWLTGSGHLWQIAGTDPMLYNEPGKDPQVTIAEAPTSGISDKLPLAPLSVSLFALEAE
jgi:hypothetical protein